MILAIVTIIGVTLVAFSAAPYIRAVLRGQVRPRLVSWGIWTVLAGIMTLAALQEGQLQSALLTGVTAAACGAILLLGWKRGSREMSRLDIVCLIGAITGVIVFFLVKDATIALAVSVAVDAVAFIPTLVHGWTNPEEESLSSFAMAASGEVFVIVAAVMSGATTAGLIYPIYAVLFNGAMTGLLIIGSHYGVESAYDYGTDEA